ncbi:response regulator transcription factor [Sphingomonas sp.]|jgi:two-component system response regulator FixJ|uniref:response regulator transcription factor n=1 Tax=Sphingomonas sp. TaxID=28214 RepID=UPI002DEBE9C4|nr:response regulator [Sphingomonas sp.]HEV2568806.1 response regulator [Sphingomonas sp.]
MDDTPSAIGYKAEDLPPDRIVYVVDDESDVRRSLGFFLKTAGFLPRPFLNGRDFLAESDNLAPGCALIDVRMPDVDGLEVIGELARRRFRLPIIVMTGHGDIATAVRAMKLGAVDFLEKPFEDGVLIEALNRGFEALGKDVHFERERSEAERRLSALTPRERDVLGLLADGKSNKEVAIALDLSVRTVEMHRATMFDRLGVRTLPEALKMAFRARPDLVLSE